MVQSAAGQVRSGREAGPQGDTAPMMVASDAATPIGAQSAPEGERAGSHWTAERQAKAQPKPTPDVDPAMVQSAAGQVRSGREAGPQGDTAPMMVASDDDAAAPIGSQSAPPGERSGSYWTPERLRSAKPMPMPVIPEDSLRTPTGPKNR